MNEKRPERLGLVSLVLGIAFIVLTALIGGAYLNNSSRLLLTSYFPLALATIFSILAAWHAYLVRRHDEERQEQQRIETEYERDDLFGDQAVALRMAESAHRQFDRYLVPAFCFIGGAVLAILPVLFFQQWQKNPVDIDPNSYLPGAGLAAFLVIFAMLIGSFFNGVSREPGCRWMRPVGSAFLLTSFYFLITMIVFLAGHFEFFRTAKQQGAASGADFTVACWMLGLQLLLGLEMIANQVLEYYRPRASGEVERPVYESRVVGFFTEPGGIARNVAHALDYQFGFKVSETWFYAFLERSVIPFFLLLVITLYLLDCFVLVENYQYAIRETYLGGHLSRDRLDEEVLGPGLYLKVPQPFQRFRKYDTERVKRVNVGFSDQDADAPLDPDLPDDIMGDPTGRLIVWGKVHYKQETVFLVASEEMREVEGGADAVPSPLAAASQSVPVNLMNANIGVFYRISDIADYAYNYQDADAVLQSLCQREVVRYFASSDMLHVMGQGLPETADVLEERMRNAVNNMRPPLGVEIRFIAFSNFHPPHQVAGAYQNVVAAEEEKNTAMLAAEREAIEMTLAAEGERLRAIAEARAHSTGRVNISQGEVLQFEKQLTAYRAAPSVFKVRTYLDVVEEIMKGKRKFYIASQGREIGILNLEDKLRPDITDLEIETNE